MGGKSGSFRAFLAALGVGAALALAAWGFSASTLAAAPRRAGVAAGAPYVGAWQALQLTDDQIQQITQIRQKAYEESAALRSQLFSKRQELALALRQAKPDEAKVQALVQEVGQLQTQLAQIQARTYLQVQNVLTDEQKAKLSAYGWFGPGLGGGFGPCGQGYGPHAGRGMMGPRGMGGPGWSW